MNGEEAVRTLQSPCGGLFPVQERAAGLIVSPVPTVCFLFTSNLRARLKAKAVKCTWSDFAICLSSFWHTFPTD